MGYVLKVRLASFFTGAAVALAMGLYALHNDYKIAHRSFSREAKGLYESLDGRISALENFKEVEATKPEDTAS